MENSLPKVHQLRIMNDGFHGRLSFTELDLGDGVTDRYLESSHEIQDELCGHRLDEYWHSVSKRRR